ncbi:MAG: GNAT family N-acetyltransferase [Pseudomonadales bacterium]
MPNDFTWQTPDLQYEFDENGMQVGTSIADWQAPPHPPKTIMTGQYCTLEPFSVEHHANDLYKAFALDVDGRNWAYMPYGPFESLEAFEAWARTTCIGEDPIFYTVIDALSGKPVGVASYLRIAAAVGSIEVGHIHFSPLLQSTRMATEAMYLMMRRVFDELGYRRYEWKCNALNAPSCRAAERFGFQFEGIFRQATISKNRNRDTAWFAIMDEDWPSMRASFERWLASDNFDADGQQIRSLREC